MSPPLARNICMLVYSIDEGGGVARSVSTLANGFAARHDVEVISLFRFRRKPPFRLDPRVRATYLQDRVQRSVGSVEERELEAQPSVLLGGDSGLTSALTDRLLECALRTLPPGVLVTHRPMLHQAAAQWAPDHTAILAMEHSTFEHRASVVHETLKQHRDRLDAVVTLNESDRLSHERHLGAAGARVATIPNAYASRVPVPSDLDRPVVVAAGVLVPNKGFDRLVRAFAPLRLSHPGWQLHIYGRGRERPVLQELIDELGLADTVVLQGFDRGFDDRLREASVFALSSHYESFSLVLLEAMAAGVPVISFDCPNGPRHLVEDGRNGLLVPDGDIPGYTRSLQRLADEPETRELMGTHGRRTVGNYDVSAVVPQWEHLIAGLPPRGG